MSTKNDIHETMKNSKTNSNAPTLNEAASKPSPLRPAARYEIEDGVAFYFIISLIARYYMNVVDGVPLPSRFTGSRERIHENQLTNLYTTS